MISTKIVPMLLVEIKNFILSCCYSDIHYKIILILKLIVTFIFGLLFVTIFHTLLGIVIKSYGYVSAFWHINYRNKKKLPTLRGLVITTICYLRRAMHCRYVFIKLITIYGISNQAILNKAHL